MAGEFGIEGSDLTFWTTREQGVYQGPAPHRLPEGVTGSSRSSGLIVGVGDRATRATVSISQWRTTESSTGWPQETGLLVRGTVNDGDQQVAFERNLAAEWGVAADLHSVAAGVGAAELALYLEPQFVLAS